MSGRRELFEHGPIVANVRIHADGTQYVTIRRKLNTKMPLEKLITEMDLSDAEQLRPQKKSY